MEREKGVWGLRRGGKRGFWAVEGSKEGFFGEDPDSSISPLDPFFKVEEERKTIPQASTAGQDPPPGSWLNSWVFYPLPGFHPLPEGRRQKPRAFLFPCHPPLQLKFPKTLVFLILLPFFSGKR